MGAYINFDLLDTAELCGLDIKSRTLAKEEVEARCPYCNDHRYRMYLNRIKGDYHLPAPKADSRMFGYGR